MISPYTTFDNSSLDAIDALFTDAIEDIKNRRLFIVGGHDDADFGHGASVLKG